MGVKVEEGVLDGVNVGVGVKAVGVGVTVGIPLPTEINSTAAAAQLKLPPANTHEGETDAAPVVSLQAPP